jgi:CRISPR-associated protein Cmr2
MSEGHLLLVSLGPVQDFIAQARRSRDLWFGSHLLSELSRATAAQLAGDGAQLIFPALDKGNPELASCDAPTRGGEAPPISIANKILAEVPDGIDPRSCAEAARAAARERWRGIARDVFSGRGKPVIAAGIDDVWNEQVQDTLEFYAVWAPLAGDYRAARQAVEQALAGRKNLREFRPWRHDRAGAPKSSLDGARVSVLGAHRNSADFRRPRISEGEQLDAIGLIKRAGLEPEQFVPLVNVAAGEWLSRASIGGSEELAAVRTACAERGIPAIHRPDLPVTDPLPFDASVLYPSRWPALFKELSRPEASAEAARQWGEKHVRPLLKRMKGEPPAYIAVLAADGDHMGWAIDGLGTAEENRNFSRALACFPAEAGKIVEHEHQGSLIYAGGDDVLAFLPVATAPDCAAALAAAFRDLIARAAAKDVPTLSVGIAVGHVIEPMSILLGLARQAERAAKDDAQRNALAIIVDKRSGGQRRLALKWETLKWERDPLGRLHRDAELLEGPLSTGKVHELEALLRRFPAAEQAVAEPKAAQALAAYAGDILAHTGESKKASLCDLGVQPKQDYASLTHALGAAIDRGAEGVG